MNPIIPSPNYLTSIWGGKRLSSIRGVIPPSGKAYGICREVCAYRNAENIVASGEYAGENLHSLIQRHHEELMGSDPSDQLVRVAYLDTADDLSLQVHPDEEYASRVENDYEKSEAWYILEAGQGAKAVVGTVIEDKDILRKAIVNGALSSYIKWAGVKAGDLLTIPAGMLHACGRDILAIEIGSFGGITYRLWDYGRGRALDIDKALAVLKPELQADIQHFAPKLRPARGFTKRPAVRHERFCADIVDIADQWEVNEKGNHYLIITAIEGEAEIHTMGTKLPLAYTHTILLPACVDKFSIQGNCRLMLSFRGPESPV